MRIIAGTLKGRTIAFPKAASIRPTQDRVREALFNVIAKKVRNSAVLDLYAGSGSLGIEAISRGAKSAVFVETNVQALRTIKANLKSLGVEDKAHVMKRDVFKAIDKLSNDGKRFDIIFMDPPYYQDLPKKTLLKLEQHAILCPNNIIIIEHSCKDVMPECAYNITLKLQKKYGDTSLSFYQRNV